MNKIIDDFIHLIFDGNDVNIDSDVWEERCIDRV